MKFPSLIDNIAPFLSPLEALVRTLGSRSLLVVALCPSQRSSLVSVDTSHPIEFVSPKALRDVLAPVLRVLKDDIADHEPSAPIAESSTGLRETLRVDGLAHVSNLLERYENGLLGSVRVLRLFACDQGCFGSPLLEENPYLAEFRWRREEHELGANALAHPREVRVSARVGVRLDETMSLAVLKLARIDELTRTLPGKDCGRCGAPSCASLAEDIVMGRAELADCLVLNSKNEGAR